MSRLTLGDVLQEAARQVDKSPSWLREIYARNDRLLRRLAMNEDRCPGCGKWCRWNRNEIGDLHYHQCASGEGWAMSVHGAPVRVDGLPNTKHSGSEVSQ